MKSFANLNADLYKHLILQWPRTIQLQPRRCPSLSPVRHRTSHLCCTHGEGPGRLCQASFKSRGRHRQAGKVWGRNLQQSPQRTTTRVLNGQNIYSLLGNPSHDYMPSLLEGLSLGTSSRKHCFSSAIIHIHLSSGARLPTALIQFIKRCIN